MVLCLELTEPMVMAEQPLDELRIRDLAARALPAGHEHLPAVHDVPPPQTTPHWPQFVLSFWKLTQLPLQRVSPVVQLAWQVPFEQTSLAAQTLPQPPQFVVLVWMLTHCPLHTTVPGPHLQAPP